MTQPAVLVFTATAGFRHDSIPAAVEAVRRMSSGGSISVEHTEDPAGFHGSRLDRFAAVVFLHTSGDVLDVPGREGLQRFVRSGGGFVGVHSATGTHVDWPWFVRLVGTTFLSHPHIQRGRIVIEDRDHPSTAHLGPDWVYTEEWYDFHRNPRPDVHVLATLDESSYEGGRMGQDHPIAWCQVLDGGRSWYTAGGHGAETWTDEAFITHVHQGIRWAAGLS